MVPFSPGILLLPLFVCGIVAVSRREPDINFPVNPDDQPQQPHAHARVEPPVEFRCGKNEKYIDEDNCGTACEPSCLNLHPRNCPRMCVHDVCQCENGFVRNPVTKECILERQCPIKYPICGKNEEYKLGGRCDPTCDGQPTCTMDLVLRCRCLPGFVRGSSQSSNCIPKNDCPNHGAVCSENEEGNDGGLICDRTCKLKGAYDCDQNITRQCRCKKGYVRLNDTECVRLHNCPELPVCDYNEEVNDDGGCERTCDDPNGTDKCGQNLIKPCRCREGTTRAPNNFCIGKYMCPQHKCARNERLVEGSKCEERTCENPLGLSSPKCLDHITWCNCRPGFVRHKESQKCIPSSNCPDYEPERKCPQNETYIENGSACNERTCEDPYPLGSYCADDFNGCQCSPGFARDKESRKCIPLSQCPDPEPKCPQNETYIESGSACNERTCKNPYPIGGGCFDHFVGCQCSPGFARDKESRKCIPLSQCPLPQPSCGKNEVYESGSHCEPTCDDPDNSAGRMCTLQIETKCRCLPGFVRDNGKCVPLSHCSRPELPLCPANEKYVDCGKQCEPSCKEPKPTACIMMCVEGCLCLPGFVRHPSGKCVPLSYCPEPKPKCPRNETYVVGGSVCDERTCENANRPRPPFTCLDYFVGCQCSPGFVRDKESRKCIRVDHCPKPKPACSQNETYVEFGSSCDERTCEYPQRPNFPCFSPFSGCQCSIGFVRNKESGKCIRVDHCPKPKPACSQNETYVEHGLKCESSCTNSEEPEDCSLLDFTGCKCSPGFVRDKDSGKCVRVSHCPNPELHACGRNEVYVENGNGCEPTCFDPHPKWMCKMLKTGCFCKSGHVRDPENKCIPESKCSDSLIRAGDDKFRHCCIDNGLPKEYLQACNYTATIEITKLMIEYLSPNKSPRDRSSAVDVASTVLKCFTGGKDVSQCCRGKGVKESCLPICSAALYEISHVNPANLMECLDLENARPNGVAREILKLAETGTECFAEANAR